MAKTIVTLCMLSVLVLALLDDSCLLYASSPLESPIILPMKPKPLPTPTKPVDNRRSTGITLEITKEKVKDKKSEYVVIGMYDNMLKMAQYKRYWPVNERRYDGCVMLHNQSWICP